MEDSLAVPGDPNHFDAATQYNEDTVMQVSAFQNHFMSLHIQLPSKGRESGNLPGVEGRKPCLDLFGRVQG
jgi:hypothetical protein